MRQTLRDILVVSDMDGTLLGPDKSLAPSDLATIELFTMLGGRFTVATGRSYASVALYPQLTRLLAPAIVCGGCVIYDFEKAKPLQNTVLPHLGARAALRDITEAFPALGTMVFGGDLRNYQLELSPHLTKLIHDEKMNYFVRPLDNLPDTWNKILFAGPQEMLKQVGEFVAERTYPGVYFVLTDPHYFEMMPKGTSKGSALHQLCDLLKVQLRDTYVVGDYYNDIDIMKQAGHAVAMQNAPLEVRQIAHETTGSNTQSGVGQFLYRIIQEYEK